MRLYPSRYYGTMEQRDDASSIYLRPDEKPRTPYALPPAGSPCPHCGRKNGVISRKDFFRCPTCGTLIEAPLPEVMPMTDELRGEEIKGGVGIIKLTCGKCGKEFRTRADNIHGLCQRCRNKILADEWRKAHPEEYRMIQAKYKGKYREKQKQQRMKGLDDAYAG